jgi:hypothetical protein
VRFATPFDVARVPPRARGILIRLIRAVAALAAIDAQG